MDPITTASLIHDRTLELQRTADQVRQERILRSKAKDMAVPDVGAEAAQARPAELMGPTVRQPASAKVGTCSPAEPAI